MTLEHRFSWSLAAGLHARPASALEELACRFDAESLLVNERTGRKASIRSVLGLVALDVRRDDPVRFEVCGADEAAAMAALRALMQRETELAGKAAALAGPSEPGLGHLPPGLRDARITWWPGRPVSGGIGIGRITAVAAFGPPTELLERAAAAPDVERRAVEQAITSVLATLEGELRRTPAGPAAEVVEAHRSVARDPELRRALLSHVEAGASAARAITATEARIAEMLRASGSKRLRERVLDVEDVCRRLLAAVYGDAARSAPVLLADASVVVADALTPGQLLALDRSRVRGLALRQAGTTSHTVILARSFEIPTLVAVDCPPAALPVGAEAVLDAEAGLLATGLDDETARRHYTREKGRLARRAARVRAQALRPAATHDGHGVVVAANLSCAAEAPDAFAAGAEGVGLFRTEMLFAERREPPSEEAQLDDYRRVVEAAAGRGVLIRTLDAGGDKPVPCLELEAEANPALGRRGVRLYPAYEPLFRAQVRALMRAAASGPLHVLLPMVSCVEELRWVKGVMADEKRRLDRAGIAAGDPPVAVMVETPAAAFAVDDLAGEAEAFSIGTNDLLQYFFAAERGNAELGAIADPLQPSFLRLLAHVVDRLHARGRWVGVCGEMASSRRYLPLLVGLGPDEISVTPPALAEIKAELRQLSRAACRELLAGALACSTAAEVAARLDAFERVTAPVVTEELVLLGRDCRSKAEAIAELAGELFVLGRTDRPQALEAALWEREATYSTGLGDGVAVPHCATPHVHASTIALLRPLAPLTWSSADDAPVDLVVLLALRESDKGSHMRIFSSLARRLVHEEFRQALRRESSAAKVLGILEDSLGDER